MRQTEEKKLDKQKVVNYNTLSKNKQLNIKLYNRGSVSEAGNIFFL